jgi:hypothetical protein
MRYTETEAARDLKSKILRGMSRQKKRHREQGDMTSPLSFLKLRKIG